MRRSAALGGSIGAASVIKQYLQVYRHFFAWLADEAPKVAGIRDLRATRTPPTELRMNLRPIARAMLKPSDVLPTPGGPTLVARLRDRTGNSGEERPSFGSALDLDFDFMHDVSYVVIAQLGVNARNGRNVNLFNTAQLTDVALSSGAQLTALSGHDYLATVPAPGSALLLLSGLAGMAMKGRFRR